MKVNVGDVIRLQPDAEVSLSYKNGEPPKKFIENALWMVDHIDEIDDNEYSVNISTFEPLGGVNAGSYCSFVHSDDIKSIEKVYKHNKPLKEHIKKLELKQLIKESIRQIIKESSYTDFITNYGQELKDAIQQLRNASKVYDDNIELVADDLEDAMERYDSNVGEQIDGWLMIIPTVDEIAKFALQNQDRFGTEPRFVLEAIETFCRILTNN